jgi:3-dehydroquinate dehydratase-1
MRRSAPTGPRIVGVIVSPADMDRAMRIRRPPNFFELRLDRLAGILDQLENKLPKLRAPLIITARHPEEGGANKLSLRQRRDLLTRFLNHAKYLDIELRSASAMRGLLTLATQKKVRRIISFHNFKSTPHPRMLARKAHTAKANGANIFKVATLTDTPIELARLLEFVTNKHAEVPIAAMGIGRLGAISRVLLARAGSALVYASVGETSDIEGQLSLKQLRALGIGRGVKSWER